MIKTLKLAKIYSQNAKSQECMKGQKVRFKKNNECESAWDNRGNTKLNQTKLQKHHYQ